jgi:hypothetical protein
MQKTLLSALSLGFFFSANVNFAADFPINIRCVDDQAEPKTRVDVGLSPAINTAQLTYQGKEMTTPIVLRVYPRRSIYSTSSVEIISNSRGSIISEDTDIKITAASKEILRATHYREFALGLTLNKSGDFAITTLGYKSGIDAFPDLQVDNSITFDNLVCTVTGL